MSFTAHKKRGKYSSKPFFIPKKYQETCIKFGLNRPAAGFLLRPGLGKTAVALFVFLILRRLGLVKELLVVVEKNLMWNVWPQEILKWEQTSRLRIATLHGSDKDVELLRKADVRLINPEGLYWLVRQKHWMVKSRKIMLVVDESTKFQNTVTQRFRALRKLLPRCSRRYILTGSPAAKKASKGIMGLFGQVFILDMGHTLGNYITHFRDQYFYPCGYLGKEWKLQPGARKRFYKKIRDLMIRFGEDQLDLPPLHFVDRRIRMPLRAREQYKELEKELVLEWLSGDVVAANAAVKSMKLRQFTGGAVKYSERKKDTKNYKLVHTCKIEELLQLLEELKGEPALIYYEFRHEVEAVRAYFKKHAPQYQNFIALNGDSKKWEVRNAIDDWKEGKIEILFSNITRGLNLQGEGGAVIYYSLPWSLEKFQQFYMRIHRQGQKRRVIVYRLIVKESVDEDIVQALYESEGDEKKFFKAMERRAS
jgi:SNF2 family DNA or RNA helicase